MVWKSWRSPSAKFYDGIGILFSNLHILEVAAYFFQLIAVRGGVAVREKIRVPVVRVLNAPRVLDRAPVLLDSPRDFDGVGQHSVSVGTVQAVKSFEGVQVAQFVPVNRDVIPSPRFGNAVNGEANGLVHGDE
jgi:hypothetical protein